MKKILLKTAILTASSSLLVASGWRIPEQSASSMALSGAYVANSFGAESAYYNPANMSFSPNERALNLSLTYIKLPKISYNDALSPLRNGKTKSEEFFIPTLFYISKEKNGYRYGFSLTTPGGLSKRWSTPLQKAYAKEFTLKIVELNPTISYKVNPTFAIGGGIRMLYSKGVVKNETPTVRRDMEGDTIEFGYNLAASFKLKNQAQLAITYRSNVDIKEKGNAKLYLSGTKVYDGGANVTIPLPAVLSVALSKKFKKTTVELEYDKTYWSKYKNLDFNYASAIPALLVPAFDDPKKRAWDDTNAYRIGITHEYNSKLKLMAGFGIDKTPIPSKYMGYELPGADAKLYSVGFEYKYKKDITISMGYLYDDKEDRTITASDANEQSINGTFKDISAHLLTISYTKRF